jgi:peptidoglycan DL-endopeptidase CwlO
VSSQRLKRTMRGALAAGAVITAVGLAPAAATAAPPTNSPASSDPMQQYQQLSAQADRLNEQINKAQVDLDDKRGQVAKATGDIATARSAEQAALTKQQQFRGQIDQLTSASFEGARMSQVSALLTGTSARDFLNKAQDLQSIAADSDAALVQFGAAADAAKAAEARAVHDQQTAQDATNAAQSLLDQLNAQKAQLRQQIQQVNQAMARLTVQQHASLANTGPQGSYVAPSGIAGRAMAVALAQRGKSYVYGGAGPDTFDCSGLVLYAYAQVGMPGIPHSAAAQQGMGVAVSQANLQPGDLVFFGNPAGHVGIYVGNGMMVDAPHTGAVVRVEPLFSDYSGARRLG